MTGYLEHPTCGEFPFVFYKVRQSGSVFLTGHDPDFHAAWGAPGAPNINRAAIGFVMDPVFNPFVADGVSRFLFAESKIEPPEGYTNGVNGIVASGFVLGTDFEHHDASTLNGELDQLGTKYGAIVVASDYGGVLTQAELDILNARAADIATFLNTGGGVYAMSESNFEWAALTPHGGHFGFLPFPVLSEPFEQAEVGYTVTSFGASLGLTNADVNGSWSHSIFTDTSGLMVVDTDASGNIISLAARGIFDPTLGACCDDATAACVDGLMEADCDGRWAAGTTCDADPSPFDPPCGLSACCTEFGCTNRLPAECEALGIENNIPVAIARGELCVAVACPRAVCLKATGDCFSVEALPTPGCQDPFCCESVCTQDPLCCMDAWSQGCADQATQVCEPAGRLAVTPEDSFQASGYQYGPFSPPSTAYRLENIGDGSLDWSASVDSPYFRVSPSGGALDPGQSRFVTVSVDQAAAAALTTPGVYENLLTFTNLTNGRANTTRALRLEVLPTVSVTVGAAYDSKTSMLSISARAFDSAAGQYLQDGTGSYEIPDLQRNGMLSFNGDRWAASVDLSDDPPVPGEYAVIVEVGAGRGETTFRVPGATGIIRGTVYDAASQPFENVTVSLHDSLASLDVPLMQTQADAEGAYELTGIPPGWYVLLVDGDDQLGYRSQHIGINVTTAEVVVRNFLLTSDQTLEQLWGRMEELYWNIRSAMSAETSRLSQMTGQAAGHFAAQPDAWDVVSFFADILSGAQGSDAALRWITLHATPETARGVFSALVKDAATDAAIGWLLSATADQTTASSVLNILPPDTNQWRMYTTDELRAREAFQTGMQNLEAARSDYQSTSGTLVVSSDFDFDRAADLIAELALKARRIREGETIKALVPPQEQPIFMDLGFPGARRMWEALDERLGRWIGTKKVVVTIQAGASALAVGATVSVVGGGLGLVAAKVAHVSSVAGLAIEGYEAHLRWEAGKQYVIALKQWSNDMLTLPQLYLNAWEFLQGEAAEVTYLTSDPSVYSATGTLDMKPDAFSDNNVPVIYTDNVSASVSRQAEITVTNTGTAPARIRVVSVSVNEFGAPLPESASAGYLDLTPAQSGTIALPYIGVRGWKDLLDPWKPHVFEAELYAGPFLQRTRFVQPYFVEYWPLALKTGPTDAAPNNSLGLTYAPNGKSRQIFRGQERQFQTILTRLADITLTPEAPMFETVFDATDLPAVEFQMSTDARGVVELRVCDTLGHCVGYDSSRDGVITEFPAQQRGGASTQQSVYIPAPGAEPYTVRAVLTGAVSAEPVKVTIWALETPVRPAIMGVSPAGYLTRLYWDETATIPLSVGEAGGQVPLSNVSVLVDDPIGEDGTSMLNVVSGGEQSFSLIPAGVAQDAEVGLHVPRGAPFGPYQGTITVESENAGVQDVGVQVVVLPMGDFDVDEDIDLDDAKPFVDCIDGPAVDSLPLGCRVADYDGNEQIDLRDVAGFQKCFNGSKENPDPLCAQ